MGVDEIRYAAGGDGQVAYRMLRGAGSFDVVVVAGSFFPMDALLDDPVARRFVEGLASIGRVVVFDKRGVGLSDPIEDWNRPAHEQWADDLLAVIDDAQLDRPVVVSWDQLGPGRCAAARDPEAVGALVLINPVVSAQGLQRMFLASSEGDEIGTPSEALERSAFPSRFDEEPFRRWLARAGRSGASPARADRMWRWMLGSSASLTPHVLPVRTLVVHNAGCLVDHAEVAAVAEQAGAELVEVAGGDVYPVAGDVDGLLSAVVRWVGVEADIPVQRMIAGILFTDLVSSTDRAAAHGDRRWCSVLDEHDRITRRAISAAGGRVVKLTGDGALALLPSASAAVEAAERIRVALASVGLDMRAGVHVGDVETRGADVAGIAVHVAARVLGKAHDGEVLVTEAARVAALGAPFDTAPPRTCELRGLPGCWLLHPVPAGCALAL